MMVELDDSTWQLLERYAVSRGVSADEMAEMLIRWTPPESIATMPRLGEGIYL